MRTVAVLFARLDSIYKTLPACEVFDIDRDARNYTGNDPVIAHPPCRAWGKLRHFAKPRIDEKALAFFAINQVRRCGGVLEHPNGSTLWREASLPMRRIDSFGGFTFPIDQDWFGHRAEKTTLLYIVGCKPSHIPEFPIKLEASTHVISPWSGLRAGMPGYRPQLRKPEREATPKPLAEWLCALARVCAR